MVLDNSALLSLRWYAAKTVCCDEQQEKLGVMAACMVAHTILHRAHFTPECGHTLHYQHGMWYAQVPVRIFITKQLPKTATGKIQRRMMVEHFIKGPGQKEEAGKGGSSGKTPAQSHQSKL